MGVLRYRDDIQRNITVEATVVDRCMPLPRFKSTPPLSLAKRS